MESESVVHRRLWRTSLDPQELVAVGNQDRKNITFDIDSDDAFFVTVDNVPIDCPTTQHQVRKNESTSRTRGNSARYQDSRAGEQSRRDLYEVRHVEITHMIERILTRIKCVFQGGGKVPSSRVVRSDDYGGHVRRIKYTKNDLELQVGV